jgi:septal ring factor EnvC (AmiA/AmiB activator)
MEGLKEVINAYTVLGAGGLCIVALIVAFFWILRNQAKERAVDREREDKSVEREEKRTRENSDQMQALISSTVKSNANIKTALDELARATDNNTRAIDMQTDFFKGIEKLLDNHDRKSDLIGRDVLEIKANTRPKDKE